MLINDLNNDKIQHGMKFTMKYSEKADKEKMGIQMLKGPSTSYYIFNTLCTYDKHVK